MSGAALTKHVVIMEKVGHAVNVWFAVRDEDNPAVYTHDLEFRADLWESLGSPDWITVTVEPGDQLNEH